MKHIIYIAMLALFVGICLSSCSKEEYDFTGDPYNRVYMNGYNNSYTITKTPVTIFSNLDYENNVKCTRFASSAIKATIEIDNSLIDAYNAANGTSYDEMPSSALVIENATLTIPADETVSTETYHITLTDNESVLSSLNSENGYLIPLRLASVSGGDALVSTNIYYDYLIVSYVEDNINHDASKSDITGTLVSNQSGWSATTNGSVSSYYDPISSMFDGIATNFCGISASEDINLDVDMGQEYTFDGLYMYYTYYWWTYGSFESGMIIYTSNDSSKWTEQGEITADESDFCALYSPVTARYVRVTLPLGGASTQYLYVGIFNVFATN
ncbi:MAG: DUF1735 domain-containing protein [Clostridia bacterium]|nr:DUF1735 domain-containing protein [Clostridia bacterium]